MTNKTEEINLTTILNIIANNDSDFIDSKIYDLVLKINEGDINAHKDLLIYLKNNKVNYSSKTFLTILLKQESLQKCLPLFLFDITYHLLVAHGSKVNFPQEFILKIETAALLGNYGAQAALVCITKFHQLKNYNLGEEKLTKIKKHILERLTPVEDKEEESWLNFISGMLQSTDEVIKLIPRYPDEISLLALSIYDFQLQQYETAAKSFIQSSNYTIFFGRQELIICFFHLYNKFLKYDYIQKIENILSHFPSYDLIEGKHYNYRNLAMYYAQTFKKYYQMVKYYNLAILYETSNPDLKSCISAIKFPVVEEISKLLARGVDGEEQAFVQFFKGIHENTFSCYSIDYIDLIFHQESFERCNPNILFDILYYTKDTDKYDYINLKVLNAALKNNFGAQAGLITSKHRYSKDIDIVFEKIDSFVSVIIKENNTDQETLGWAYFIKSLLLTEHYKDKINSKLNLDIAIKKNNYAAILFNEFNFYIKRSNPERILHTVSLYNNLKNDFFILNKLRIHEYHKMATPSLYELYYLDYVISTSLKLNLGRLYREIAIFFLKYNATDEVTKYYELAVEYDKPYTDKSRIKYFQYLLECASSIENKTKIDKINQLIPSSDVEFLDLRIFITQKEEKLLHKVKKLKSIKNLVFDIKIIDMPDNTMPISILSILSKQINQLEVTCFKFAEDGHEILNTIKSNPHIRHLKFRNFNFNGKSFQILADIINLKKLESLSFSKVFNNNDIRKGDLFSFCKKISTPSIKELSILPIEVGVNIDEFETFLKAFIVKLNLERLHLINCFKINGNQNIVINVLKYIATRIKLKEISLSQLSLNDHFLEYFSEFLQLNPSLERIDISKNNFSYAAMIKLLKDIEKINLDTLNLENFLINPKENNDFIEALVHYLGHCSLTCITFPFISTIEHLTSIMDALKSNDKILKIEFNQYFDEDGVKLLLNLVRTNTSIIEVNFIQKENTNDLSMEVLKQTIENVKKSKEILTEKYKKLISQLPSKKSPVKEKIIETPNSLTTNISLIHSIFTQLKFELVTTIDSNCIRFRLIPHTKSIKLTELYLKAFSVSLDYFGIDSTLSKGKAETLDSIKVFDLETKLIDTKKFGDIFLANIANLRDQKNNISKNDNRLYLKVEEEKLEVNDNVNTINESTIFENTELIFESKSSPEPITSENKQESEFKNETITFVTNGSLDFMPFFSSKNLNLPLPCKHKLYIQEHLEALEIKSKSPKDIKCAISSFFDLVRIMHYFCKFLAVAHTSLSITASNLRNLLCDRPDYFLIEHFDTILEMFFSDRKSFYNIFKLVSDDKFFSNQNIYNQFLFSEIQFYQDFFSEHRDLNEKNNIPLLEEDIDSTKLILIKMKTHLALLKDIDLHSLNSKKYTQKDFGMTCAIFILLGYYSRILRDHHSMFQSFILCEKINANHHYISSLKKLDKNSQIDILTTSDYFGFFIVLRNRLCHDDEVITNTKNLIYSFTSHLIQSNILLNKLDTLIEKLSQSTEYESGLSQSLNT